MGTATTAFAADRDTLIKLRTEQSELLTLIKNKDKGFTTMREKVQRIAEIIKERMQYADPEISPLLTLNQISTYITHMFREHQISFAPWVSEVLPDEYKDPSQQRKMSLLEDGSASPSQDPATAFMAITPHIREIKDKINSLTQAKDLADVYEFVHEADHAVRSRAQQLQVVLPGFEPHESHKTPLPEPKITTCYDATLYGIKVLTGSLEFWRKFPPPPHKEALWAAGIVQLFKLFPSQYNDKFSLIRLMWWSRIKYMIHQSKHGAAVKDEVMTMLCEVCYDVKTGKELPDTNAEMMRDFKSITGWRCGSCGGIKGHMRGLTREQVGDNKAPVITQCEEFVSGFPHFVDMVESYIEDKMPYTHARKVDLGVELSRKA